MREYIELVAEQTAERIVGKVLDKLPCPVYESRIRQLEYKTAPYKAVWWVLGILFVGIINTAFWAFRG